MYQYLFCSSGSKYLLMITTKLGTKNVSPRNSNYVITAAIQIGICPSRGSNPKTKGLNRECET